MVDSLLTEIGGRPIAFIPMEFSRNRLFHTIDAANPDLTSRANLSYCLEIQVPTFPQSLVFEPLHRSTGKEPPVTVFGNTNSFAGATFEYNRRNGKLDGLLNYQKPNWQQEKITSVFTQTTPFKLRELVTGGTPNVNTDTTLATRFCIKAGLNDEDFAMWADTFWTKYQFEQRRFLTWQPNNKLIGRDQEEYLSFLMNFSPKPSKVCLRVQSYKPTGTNTFTAKELEVVTQNSVVLCPVGCKALGLDNDVYQYDVWLSDEQNRRFTEIRTFQIDSRYRANERSILFSNSLGGFDTIRLVGKATETLKVSQTYAQRDKSVQGIDWMEMVVINTEGQRELVISTGWFERSAKDYLKYLDELMLSEQVYLVTDKGHIPLRKNTNALVDVEDNTELIARSFSFTYDRTIQNYSDAPSIGAVPARATTWEGLDFTHILDSFGRRTGRMRPARIRKVYSDDKSLFKPLTIKPNVESDPDYIAFLVNPSIVPGSSPYPNTAIVRQGTFVRSNCGNGKTGGYATINIPAGRYGSETPGEAQQLAELEYTTLNTQEYANAYGECILNPYDYAFNVPANYAHFRQSGMSGADAVSKDNANGVGKGNAWFLQGQSGQTDLYPVGVWDINLPTNYLMGFNWRFILYGTNFGFKVYVNGQLIYNVAQVPTVDSCASIEIPHNQIPSGARVYLLKV